MDNGGAPDPELDPLVMILPLADDRLLWRRTAAVQAADTGDQVFAYEHRAIGRTLRLDAQGRVYGQDSEGVVRLFGRGGALALAVALNAIYDGLDGYRPTQVVLPESATQSGP